MGTQSSGRPAQPRAGRERNINGEYVRWVTRNGTLLFRPGHRTLFGPRDILPSSPLEHDGCGSLPCGPDVRNHGITEARLPTVGQADHRVRECHSVSFHPPLNCGRPVAVGGAVYPLHPAFYCHLTVLPASNSTNRRSKCRTSVRRCVPRQSYEWKSQSRRASMHQPA